MTDLPPPLPEPGHATVRTPPDHELDPVPNEGAGLAVAGLGAASAIATWIWAFLRIKKINDNAYDTTDYLELLYPIGIGLAATSLFGIVVGFIVVWRMDQGVQIRMRRRK